MFPIELAFCWRDDLVVTQRRSFEMRRRRSDRMVAGVAGGLADALGVSDGFVRAAFITRTYNDLLYIFLGLSSAVTNVFVSRSDRKYKLIEQRDLVVAFVVMVAALMFVKMFVIFYW